MSSPPPSPARSATTVYTDGACRGNPGPGGWAWVVPDGPWASGADPDTTNQRMELTAVLDAVRTLPGPLEVVSDSTYVVNCFRDGWWRGWLKRGWTNSKKEPVANRDLWEPLIDRYRDREHELAFRWVKGHGGDEWNDIADRLAVEASVTQRGRTGEGRPTELGPADEITGSASALPSAPADTVDRSIPADRADEVAGGVVNQAWRPAGPSVVVLGLQPPGLGGYDDNPVAGRVRDRLTEILAAKAEVDPGLVVLTGLRLGAETLGAEAAAAAGVPYVAVLPYPDPDIRWPSAARARFAALRDGAAVVVELERRVPDSPARAGQALDRRNGWLRRVADAAVIVWDGHDRRVGELVRRFEHELPDDVWVVPVDDTTG